ncbi:hypothetical protein HPB50_009592 [Hyalomma asiaticum]|uniref:Uncharacterized protein n=1 Tax=Hyalomma asiaticum TaxID=266040 RepID=A0ACB7T713_HYAAI|nr:hypothetical protein HPB50_009592 [Hyalomma asiaticum]
MLPGRRDKGRAAGPSATELWDKDKGRHSVAYADAAAWGNGKYLTIVVSESGRIFNMGRVEASSAIEAEEPAIALAITKDSNRIIVSEEKKNAILNHASFQNIAFVEVMV